MSDRPSEESCTRPTDVTSPYARAMDASAEPDESDLVNPPDFRHDRDTEPKSHLDDRPGDLDSSNDKADPVGPGASDRSLPTQADAGLPAEDRYPERSDVSAKARSVGCSRDRAEPAHTYELTNDDDQVKYTLPSQSLPEASDSWARPTDTDRMPFAQDQPIDDDPATARLTSGEIQDSPASLKDAEGDHKVTASNDRIDDSDLDWRDLPRSTDRLYRSDYPFLEPPKTHELEEGVARPGPGPNTLPGEVVNNPDGRQEPTEDIKSTFAGEIQPFNMEPGVTYYRVIGDNSRPDGEFWTITLPRSEQEVRGDLAVRNEWNGNHGVVAHSPAEQIRGWLGVTAPQRATGSDDWHLAGGGNQLWIPRGSLSLESGQWRIAPLDLTRDEK